MCLLAVHKRSEVNTDHILLTARDGGISSEKVITSHRAWRSSIKAKNDKGPSHEPWGITPFSNLQEETQMIYFKRWQWWARYDKNYCSKQFGMLNLRSAYLQYCINADNHAGHDYQTTFWIRSLVIWTSI